MANRGVKPTDVRTVPRTVTITINEDNFEVDVVGDLLIIDLMDILKTLMEDLLDELEKKTNVNSKMH